MAETIKIKTENHDIFVILKCTLTVLILFSALALVLILVMTNGNAYG